MRRLHHLKKLFPRRVIPWIASAVGGFILIGIAGAFYIIKTVPPAILLENREIVESTKIYDRTGTVLLYEIHGEERRTVIPFDEIPDIVKQATIALEDANFYEHAAFDWKSIVRAFLVNLRSGEIVQGGSTITQQLAKKAFLTDDRTPTRKLRELVLAIQLERRFTKDEILGYYLNQIPYGSNAYGIEAASQMFFSKHAGGLTISEAATLAALPRAPSYYSPWGSHQDALIARRNRALTEMEYMGAITEEERDKAIAEAQVFSKQDRGIKAPHFVIAVQEYLNERYGEEFVREGGLTVTTTLDWKLQKIAERVVLEGAVRNEELYHGKNAALVAEDTDSGQILALVGSRDYFDIQNEGNFDVATQGLRQPGSAMKPLVYVNAFAKGYPPETVLFDLDTEFSTEEDPEKSYRPVNFDGRFRGPISLRNALAQSINIPAVKTLYLVGIDNVLKSVKSFGITTLTERNRYGLSLVLGGGEVRLIELVGAYATFAEEGIYRPQTMVLKVQDGERVLESFSQEAEQVIDPEPVRILNDVLSDRDARAPIFGSALDLPGFSEYQVAVKTGTSNDYRDAWSVGYTPSLAVGVWAGNNNNDPMGRGESVRAAAPIWRAFMSEVLPSYAPQAFTAPNPIFTEKPVLKGEYVVNYQYGSELFPHIHEILHSVDRNDPLGPEPSHPENDSQFENWEKPLTDWIQKNYPNPQTVNRPLPEGSVVMGSGTTFSSNKIEIAFASPTNGSVLSPPLTIEVPIKAAAGISKIELSLNETVIDAQIGSWGNETVYRYRLIPSSFDLQNLIKVTVTDALGNRESASVIVFRTP
ncbi:MAG: PBP1A family penicillin-binding protein [Patescibacteria group bacterium]